jgi:phosphomannomutase
MSLVISISGIRGTIGGRPTEALTPIDTVQFASAYASWLIQDSGKDRPSLVLGRDARISGPMVEQLVSATLTAMGVDVYLMGLATTPTVEMAVTQMGADGGIILTASHNPAQWNALKLLNSRGEFLSGEDGEAILQMARANDYSYADVKKLGAIKPLEGMGVKHIDQVLMLDLVKPEVIRKKKFRVAIDCVNSVGGIILPQLLDALGVEEVIELYCEPTGDFPHDPEPLPEHLTEISEVMVREKADVGFVVDPDVDRLAIVCEDGSMFGEEYTLVAVADYILSRTPGNTASNLSSTRALRDVTEAHGQSYYPAAVGEVNVVNAMKEHKCVIGGEGNGGIIYPQLHYGRDALVGIALFLTHLAESDKACSVLRKTYPDYFISKNKISLPEGADPDQVLASFEQAHAGDEINTVDGVKLDLPEGWVHLRKSNTEPIIRLYAEAGSQEEAENLAGKAMETVHRLIN